MSDSLIETLKRDEGFINKATHVTTRSGEKEKNRTIGYGYNIDAHLNPSNDLIEAGVSEEDVEGVLRGEKEIDETTAVRLLHLSTVRAQQDAQRVVPRYDKLPPEVQEVVTNMAYQMGPTGLLGFKKFREALYQGDYEKAAKEILDSKFARKDAPERAKRHAKVLSGLAKSQGEAVTPPSQQERLKSAKEELLMQRVMKVRRNQPDPLLERASKLFLMNKDKQTTETEDAGA